MRLIKALLAFALAFLIACSPTVESTLAKYSSSVLKLENEDSICSAFYVGGNFYITALHCLNFEEHSFHQIQVGNKIQPVSIVDYDTINDVGLIWAPDFGLEPLEIWEDGHPADGREIINIGFPGYAFGVQSFEVSHLLGHFEIDSREILLAREMGYPGSSGGPVIDVKSGKVIGFADKTIEQVEILESLTHQHTTLSMITPYTKIFDLIEKNKDLNQ